MKNVKKTAIICGALAIFMICATVVPGEKNAPSAPVVTAKQTTDILLDGDNPFLKLVAASYSPRAFAKGEVKDRDIERILLCGAKAPSAKNGQPWHFTVVKNYGKVAGLTGLAKEGSVLIVISGRQEVTSVRFDCGLATQNMQLAAQALGLGARILVQPVSEIEKNQKAALGIPQGYDVLATILIGYVDKATDAVSSASPRGELSQKVNYVR